jgi:hypothetical protein
LAPGYLAWTDLFAGIPPLRRAVIEAVLLTAGAAGEKPENVRISAVGTGDGTGNDRIGRPTTNGAP